MSSSSGNLAQELVSVSEMWEIEVPPVISLDGCDMVVRLILEEKGCVPSRVPVDLMIVPSLDIAKKGEVLKLPQINRWGIEKGFGITQPYDAVGLSSVWDEDENVFAFMSMVPLSYSPSHITLLVSNKENMVRGCQVRPNSDLFIADLNRVVVYRAR